MNLEYPCFSSSSSSSSSSSDDDDDEILMLVQLQKHNIMMATELLRQQNPDIDISKIPLHLRPLVSAAESGDVNALTVALEDYEGDIDDPVEDGDTLLHLACLYGHLNCVKGSNLEAQDADGGIPLHDACEGGYTDIVQLLISHAKEPERVKRMLETVDTEGDRGEHSDAIRLLLAHGAPPSKKNIFGKTPLELAGPETEAWRVLKEAVGAKARD